jgi:hypothetical protein
VIARLLLRPLVEPKQKPQFAPVGQRGGRSRD